MNTHKLQLTVSPFNAIISGAKTIESRLYDDKRQLIKIGDIIVFTNREMPSQTISVRVTNLLHHDTFHSLFSSNNPTKFGGTSVEQLEKQVSQFYSTDQQNQNGVVGIEFVLLQ
jgi:ASC-1-like (ASCH) protein